MKGTTTYAKFFGRQCAVILGLFQGAHDELFFRFFKHVLGCRHLFSDRRRGIEIQTYCAIIACMLISLYTGRKPTLRTMEMLCWYFLGWATEEELLAHLEKLRKQTTA